MILRNQEWPVLEGARPTSQASQASQPRSFCFTVYCPTRDLLQNQDAHASNSSTIKARGSLTRATGMDFAILRFCMSQAAGPRPWATNKTLPTSGEMQ
jgi:hypothetical protein